jgi:hypothetical protein
MLEPILDWNALHAKADEKHSVPLPPADDPEMHVHFI